MKHRLGLQLDCDCLLGSFARLVGICHGDPSATAGKSSSGEKYTDDADPVPDPVHVDPSTFNLHRKTKFFWGFVAHKTDASMQVRRFLIPTSKMHVRAARV